MGKGTTYNEGNSMARVNAHEYCLHQATPAMRNKCRRVHRVIRDELSSSSDDVLKGVIGHRVVGWRMEDSETTGPKLIRYDGTLERSYQHRDGLTVWVIVSDERPQGTGHPAQFVHVM